MKRRILISLLLVLLIVFNLAPAMGVMNDHSVVISEADSVFAIQTAIQAAIDSAGSGDTIVVTGSKNDADSTLYLDIPTDKTVVWQAEYSGAVNYENLIHITGGGVLEVAEDGTVELTGNWCDTIYVSEGDVMVFGRVTLHYTEIEYGCAIYVQCGNVTVSGNAIIGSAFQAIAVEEGNVTISGGIVEAASRAIAIGEGNITVSGGIIRQTGYYDYAIISYGGSITISDGLVESSSGAIYMDGGLLKITGGEVKAGQYTIGFWLIDTVGTYLSGTVSGLMGGLNSTFVEVDCLDIPRARNRTQEGLTIKIRPKNFGTAEVRWDTTGDVPRILFQQTNGTNISIVYMEWGVYAD